MSTILQTVNITEDRRITLTVPDDVSLGTSEIKVSFLPMSQPVEKKRNILEFAGCLKGSGVFDAVDSVELQRKWRDEWERD
ncbi:hypothetical protein FACS18942_02110 [Planctomycetales bacterium]|nr:hypothetical protein FACS18942_02110 [Planctomycetales bacterium]